jgi:hypothetical protein
MFGRALACQPNQPRSVFSATLLSNFSHCSSCRFILIAHISVGAGFFSTVPNNKTLFSPINW